jgi:hypothetical protein
MVKKKSDGNKKVVRKNNSPKNINVEKALIENFVSLQKVMTTMAVKFDSLSSQISKLLELFEISAKSLAEKGYSMEDRKVAEKLDSLLEQNKIIAKGIALLHEKESYEPPMQMPVQQMQRFQPMQRMEPSREIPPRQMQMPPQENLKVKEMGA